MTDHRRFASRAAARLLVAVLLSGLAVTVLMRVRPRGLVAGASPERSFHFADGRPVHLDAPPDTRTSPAR